MAEKTSILLKYIELFPQNAEYRGENQRNGLFLGEKVNIEKEKREPALMNCASLFQTKPDLSEILYMGGQANVDIFKGRANKFKSARIFALEGLGAIAEADSSGLVDAVAEVDGRRHISGMEDILVASPPCDGLFAVEDQIIPGDVVDAHET
jgi:hypothetical protein